MWSHADDCEFVGLSRICNRRPRDEFDRMGGEMKLKHNSWVVVMDGEKALFLRNDGDAVHCNLQVFREIE